MGLHAIVVVEEPNPAKTFSVEEKVDWYLDLSEAFIALCASDERRDDGNTLNILDEIARARSRSHIRDRVAIFKSDDVQLPSNIAPAYYRLNPSDPAAAITALRDQVQLWDLMSEGSSGKGHWGASGSTPHADLRDDEEQLFRAVERRFSLVQLPALASTGAGRLAAVDDVYVPLDLDRVATHGRGLDEAGVPAEDFLERRAGGVSQLVGGLGVGKSSLLAHLALTAARDALTSPLGGALALIPVSCPAAAVAARIEQGEPLADAILHAAARNLFAESRQASFRRAMEAAIKEGRALVLFDALDEHPGSIAQRSTFWQRLVTGAVGDLGGCPVLVTTRDHAASDAPAVARYVVARLTPETAQRLARGYIRQSLTEWALGEPDVARVAEAVATTMVRSTNELLLTPLHAMFLAQIAASESTPSAALANLAELATPAAVYGKYLDSIVAWEGAKGRAANEVALRDALGALAARELLGGLFWPFLSPAVQSTLYDAAALEFWVHAGVVVRSPDVLPLQFRHRDLALWSLAQLLRSAVDRAIVKSNLEAMMTDRRDDVLRIIAFLPL